MYEVLCLVQKKTFGICVCVIISVSTSPWMLHKKTSSCGQQSVASNIKSLSIKLLELITLKDKTLSPCCALLMVSYPLPFLLHQNQGIKALTYSLPQVIKAQHHGASRELFLPCLCRADHNKWVVHCFWAHATTELLQGPLLQGLSTPRADLTACTGCLLQEQG